MANYTSLTLIWCACIFVDSLSKKRERCKFTSCSHHSQISHMRIVQTRAHNISPKKNHTLKDEIIISAQKGNTKS